MQQRPVTMAVITPVGDEHAATHTYLLTQPIRAFPPISVNECGVSSVLGCCPLRNPARCAIDHPPTSGDHQPLTRAPKISSTLAYAKKTNHAADDELHAWRRRQRRHWTGTALEFLEGHSACSTVMNSATAVETLLRQWASRRWVWGRTVSLHRLPAAVTWGRCFRGGDGAKRLRKSASSRLVPASPSSAGSPAAARSAASRRYYAVDSSDSRSSRRCHSSAGVQPRLSGS
jgi:hypothetical protein